MDIKNFFDGFAIANDKGFIYIWDAELNHTLKVVELSMFNFKLMSFEITKLSFIQSRLLVSTSAGDIIEIRMHKESQRITPRRIGGIIPIQHHITAMTILDQSKPMLITGSDDAIVVSIDLNSHEILDVWGTGHPVTSLYATTGPTAFQVLVGTGTGDIIIRKEWDETKMI